MNDTNKIIKYKTKFNIDKIKQCAKNGQFYQRSVICPNKDYRGQTCNLILKNHTTYNSSTLRNYLWAHSKDVVKKELVGFYQSIMKADAELVTAAIHGLKQHIAKYDEYHARAVKEYGKDLSSKTNI